MRTLFLITLCIISIRGIPQNALDSILAQIEVNNPTLRALRLQAEADKIGSRVGLSPQDPGVEFNYLWGSPSLMGNRTDLILKQSFEFPTVYKFQGQIADLRSEQSEIEFQRQRREILHKARLICVELTYQNALQLEYSRRLEHARELANVYRRKLDAGEVGLLDYNKAQVHLLNVTKTLQNIELERNFQFGELSRLNGGRPVIYVDTLIVSIMPSSDFNQWYVQVEQNNPMLHWLNQELAITQMEGQLQTARNLPKFSAGYLSERIPGETFQGIAVGVSIPLWENRNAINYIEAKEKAVEGLRSDYIENFLNEMRTVHAKVLSLQRSTAGYRTELTLLDNTYQLGIALEKGEISLGDYFVELSIYYDSVDNLLAMEHSLNLSLAELLRLR